MLGLSMHSTGGNEYENNCIKAITTIISNENEKCENNDKDIFLLE